MDKILGEDLDEVLSDTVEEILKFHDYKIKWIPIQKNQITNYYVHDMTEYDISLDEAIHFLSLIHI